MSNSGGWNPFKWDSESWGNNLLNVATLGLLGVGDDGRLSGGLVGDGVKQATGAAALEKQMEQAEARALEERAALEKMREEEMMMKERDDRAASARANSLRTNTGNFLGL